MTNREMKENPKHRKFAELYHRTGNATKSYMIVYAVKEGSARAAAPRLLTNANVQAIISDLQQEAREGNKNLVQETIDELKNIAQSNIVPILVGMEATAEAGLELENLPVEIQRTIQSFEMTKTTGGGEENPWEKTNIKFKLHDKMNALNTLTRIFSITGEEQSQEDELEKLTNQELWALIVKTMNDLAAKRGHTLIPVKALMEGEA